MSTSFEYSSLKRMTVKNMSKMIVSR